MRFYNPSPAFYGFNPPENEFYAGGALSTLVPRVFPVSINGRPYMIDVDQPFYRQYHRQLAPLIRTQADTSKLPGETTLDPNGLWRRSWEDPSLGAGQRYLDRDTSVNNGFFQSKGVDCLTNKWQIQLLQDTQSVRSSVNTNLQVVAANGFIYCSDGNNLLFTSTLNGASTLWTTVTGTPASAITSICTDGFTVYAAYGVNGIYQTTAGAAGATQLVTSPLSTTAVIGYVNNRLMVGNGVNLYNVTSNVAAALPAPLLTTNNPNTVWVGFAEGNNFIYIACQVGNNSYIYGTQVNTDGTSLTGPSVQGKLPLGESITSILGYLGQIIVGSSLGVRYINPASGGSLPLGGLISGVANVGLYGPTQPVKCLAGYGRWVWFGWSQYDNVSSGLGRCDLQNFAVPGVTPAFASDLMATGQQAVTSVTIFGTTPVFVLQGVGIYSVNPAQKVASGTLQSGYVLFGMTENKIFSLLDVQTVGALTDGQYTASLSIDGGTFSAIGVHMPNQPEPVTFSTNGVAGQRAEILLTLQRGTTNLNFSPVITRWTLRAYPAPRRAVTWQLPIILNERIVDQSMASEGLNPLIEVQALELMAALGVPVVYQEAGQSYQVFVQDVEFLPDELTSSKDYFNGICLVTLEGLPQVFTGIGV